MVLLSWRWIVKSMWWAWPVPMMGSGWYAKVSPYGVPTTNGELTAGAVGTIPGPSTPMRYASVGLLEFAQVPPMMGPRQLIVWAKVGPNIGSRALPPRFLPSL